MTQTQSDQTSLAQIHQSNLHHHEENGGIQLVQNIRAFNAETQIKKKCMRDKSYCIGEIGRSGSSIFSMLDLTARFEQMLLELSSQPYTAFTDSRQGQLQWIILPMGILGCPTSFQKFDGSNGQVPRLNPCVNHQSHGSFGQLQQTNQDPCQVISILSGA